MTNTAALTLYGPTVLILLIAAWGLIRILYLWKADNVSVLAVLKQKKSPAERGLSLVALILDGYLLLRPIFPQLDDFLYTQQSTIPLIGLTVMAVGLLIILICQFTMGRAWRIGVPAEKEQSQTLVTKGMYAYSRNPIYVGVMLFLVGSVVLLPNPLTVTCTLLTWIFLHTVIRKEEIFMKSAFGNVYEEYFQRVRRWL